MKSYSGVVILCTVSQYICFYESANPIISVCQFSCSISPLLGKQDTFMGIGGRYAKFQAKNRDFGNVWKIAGQHSDT